MQPKKVIFIPTIKEAEGIFERLCYSQHRFGYLESFCNDKKIVISGVTKTNIALSTFSVLSSERFEEAYLIGIAGAYKKSGLELGEVVSIKYDYFADESLLLDNKITLLSELGFPVCEENKVCFMTMDNLKLVNSNTVSLISGTDSLAELYFNKTGASVENMEGAAFGLVAEKFGIPFFHIRAISNYCGNRDNQMWNTKKALCALKNFYKKI